MKFVFSPEYRADIGTHVFPTEKYHGVYDKLKEQGIITGKNVSAPEKPAAQDLLKIITPEYLDDLLNQHISARTLPSEMPVNKAIINAQILCCGGSYLAAKIAVQDKACYHIGGGFHHAFRDHAEGFCYLNDVVFAAVMMLEQGFERIAVIDCDLHQGNGTAKFFEDEKRVFTFSIHQERLYPKKERSNMDVGLDIGTSDKEYLEKLGKALDIIHNDFQPDFIIFVAGADPYILDQLGSLRLTIEGLNKRDELVIRSAYEKGIPIIAVLAGGYAEDIDDTIEIHCNTARTFHRIYSGSC
jgi:acetoin utilization deacetylase AcuC-like enzyme